MILLRKDQMAIGIGRRQFISVLGGASLAWPLVARAQQPERVRRIGILMPFAESEPLGQAQYAAFWEGLQKFGWTEGRNIRVDARFATNPSQFQPLAKELLGEQPD